ncbi:MAG: Hpt domain-containing protein [Magnetospirillum sp.]
MADWRQAPVVDDAVTTQLRQDLDEDDFVLVHAALADDIRGRMAELAAALAADDAETARRAIHSLKGAALNLGHARLGLLCSHLNQCALASDWSAIRSAWDDLRAVGTASLAALGHGGLAFDGDSSIVRH